ASPLARSEWGRIIALVLLCALNISYWGVYEQQGNSMQAWADTSTNWPIILGFQVPSAWYQSMNPFMIFMLAPLLDMAWRWQAKRGTEPDTVTKMAIGSLLLGLSFIVMVIGAKQIGEGTGSVWWLVGCVFILTIGELYLSPIGLSLVTKASPKRMISMMMGMWFLSSFFGGYFAGYIGTWYDDMPKEQFFMALSAIGFVTGLAMWAFKRPLHSALKHDEVKQ
ncbi:MAG TPA: MFS transporter, partial [Candidatus Kerfeldbacteria bacterium]|nr:MFS transporter [Candidatus Kerfeldbacteria bacterium]